MPERPEESGVEEKSLQERIAESEVVRVTTPEGVYRVPQSWNKLSLRQQIECYRIIMTDMDGLFDSNSLYIGKRMLLLDPLCGITPDFLERWKTDCIRANRESGETEFYSELDQLLHVTDFLFEEQKEENEPEEDFEFSEDEGEKSKKYSISLTLTKNPWPQLKKTRGRAEFIPRKPKAGPPRSLDEVEIRERKEKNVKLFGPKDKLENFSLYELGISFTLFEHYLKTGEMKFAYRLLATIYRPPKPDTRENMERAYEGDLRLPLQGYEATVDLRVPLMKLLPDLSVQLLLFFFASCREQIIRHPEWSKLFSEGGDKISEKYGWGGIILKLAGGLRDMEDVGSKDYETAFTYLSLLEDERRQEEMKRAARKAGLN